MSTSNSRLVIGIDPSINHTGYSILEVGHNTGVDSANLLTSGVIRFNPADDDGRFGSLFLQLYDIIDSFVPLDFPTECILERPTFENSERGKELVKNKGLPKLCMAAGILLGPIAARKISYGLVTANQWKRGFPKPTIRARVEQLCGRSFAYEDEWEAIGIAYWSIANHAKIRFFGSHQGNHFSHQHGGILQSILSGN